MRILFFSIFFFMFHSLTIQYVDSKYGNDTNDCSSAVLACGTLPFVFNKIMGLNNDNFHVLLIFDDETSTSFPYEIDQILCDENFDFNITIEGTPRSGGIQEKFAKISVKTGSYSLTTNDECFFGVLRFSGDFVKENYYQTKMKKIWYTHASGVSFTTAQRPYYYLSFDYIEDCMFDNTNLGSTAEFQSFFGAKVFLNSVFRNSVVSKGEHLFGGDIEIIDGSVFRNANFQNDKGEFFLFHRNNVPLLANNIFDDLKYLSISINGNNLVYNSDRHFDITIDNCTFSRLNPMSFIPDSRGDNEYYNPVVLGFSSKFSSFTLKNSKFLCEPSKYCYATGVSVAAYENGSALIEDCEFTGFSGTPIHIYGDQPPLIKRCSFHDNHFGNHESAIDMIGSPYTFVRASIQDSEFYNNVGNIVYIQGPTEMSFNSSTLRDNIGAGETQTFHDDIVLHCAVSGGVRPIVWLDSQTSFKNNSCVGANCFSSLKKNSNFYCPEKNFMNDWAYWVGIAGGEEQRGPGICEFKGDTKLYKKLCSKYYGSLMGWHYVIIFGVFSGIGCAFLSFVCIILMVILIVIIACVQLIWIPLFELVRKRRSGDQDRELENIPSSEEDSEEDLQQNQQQRDSSGSSVDTSLSEEDFE